jgi:hypothetical protein
MHLQSLWRHRVLLGLLLVGLIALLSWWFFPQEWLWIVALIAFGTFCVGMVGMLMMELPGWLVDRDARHNQGVKPLTDDQRLTAVSSARSTMVQGIVGLLALGGIAVAWQQLNNDRVQSQANQRQLNTQLELSNKQLELSRQGQVAERSPGQSSSSAVTAANNGSAASTDLSGSPRNQKMTAFALWS